MKVHFFSRSGRIVDFVKLKCYCNDPRCFTLNEDIFVQLDELDELDKTSDVRSKFNLKLSTSTVDAVEGTQDVLISHFCQHSFCLIRLIR